MTQPGSTKADLALLGFVLRTKNSHDQTGKPCVGAMSEVERTQA